ncbi:cytochrome P450 [Crassisporium funariophilum]|nr:cytochrome P450 [Crassisporium funariophilum]
MSGEMASITSGFITPVILLSALGAYYSVLWYFARQRRLKGFTVPPGPKQAFLTGNLHQLPRSEPWLKFTSWSKVYGPIVYFRVFNKETIILNSAKVVSDLLESRSLVYSDRPTVWMGGELAGRKWSVFHTSFSDPRFRAFRRLLHNGLNPRASKTYRPIQTQETMVLLTGLANSPDKFAAHIRRNAVAVILKVAYGYQVAGIDDLLVKIIEEGFQLSASLGVPGKYWVEFFPFLRFLPDWFPGAGFKRVAKRAGQEMSRVEQIPFEWAKKQIAEGDYVESFTSKHLCLDGGRFAEKDIQEELKWCSAALYVGGGDTTVSALSSFFLLMALYPDVQRRTQSDIDSVVSGRLPTLDDYNSLPYIAAMIKEIIRWAPVAPLGLPHRVMEDDVYEQYLIPKGTSIIANIWAITHDEDIYPDPFVFDPSRHLGEKPQPDPFKYVFGFGRRICPGAHLAEMSLFLNISNILAVFNISKPVDANGQNVEPRIAWTSGGATMHPKPFECHIKPRSNEHLLLLG